MEDYRRDGQRVYICLPKPERGSDVACFLVENRDHLAPFDPPRPEGFYTTAYWEEQLRQNRDEIAKDRSARFWVVEQDSDVVLGVCNVTNIVRGPFQCGNLGYAIGMKHQGKGLMREALELLIEFSFSELRLHRLQANYLPENTRSGRLLERLGFVREGLARHYLYIAGAWRDHVLTSLTNPHPSAPA